MLKHRIKKYLKNKLNIKPEITEGISGIIQDHNFIPISEVDDNDIFIAGYPKSGNTWMQNLIAGALYGIDTSLLPDKLTQEIVPDVHAKKYYKRFGDTTFFKTHELPEPHMKNVIHLVRDGRDVMASYYAMNKALNMSITLEDMILNGEGIFPSKWHIHTKEWLSNPFNAKVIIIKYEGLIEDAENELKKALDFFNIKRSDNIISQSVNGNTFNEMQRKEKEHGWYNTNWDKNEKFIRKGKIGSYKTEIPPELIKAFEKEAFKELEKFKYPI